jgi:hypothetical protein
MTRTIGTVVVLGLLLWPSAAWSQQVNLAALPTDDGQRALPSAPPHASSASVSTWRGAFVDSLRLLMLEHSWRVAAQAKTRRQLAGPFFSDYVRSVKWPTKWGDGDGWLVNYLGHPLHGAAAGRTWINNDPNGRWLDLGLSREYWISRGKAVRWSAVYSIQFEFGPLSEASFGNVGLDPKTSGWVDHFVTPVGALGFIVAEDAVDKYVVQLIERHTGNRVVRATLRVLLNPSRTLANMVDGHLPWFRDRGGLKCCR